MACSSGIDWHPDDALRLTPISRFQSNADDARGQCSGAIRPNGIGEPLGHERRDASQRGLGLSNLHLYPFKA
jgi:hypothetical protein